MPDAFSTRADTEATTVAKTGKSKSKAPKPVKDIVLFMERDHLEAFGVEQTLRGLKNILPMETSQLHLVHFSKKPFKMPDKLLSQVHEDLQNTGLKVIEERFCPLNSETVTQLVEEIQKTDYELLVFCMLELPNSHHNPYAHLVHHMVSHVPISALVWRKQVPAPQPLKILFAVDGSESSLNAIGKAPELLRLKYAHLNLVIVLSPVFQDNAITAPFVNPDVLDQALDANASMIFDMADGIIQSHGLMKPSRKKLLGSPATELGYWAETENPDLIIVGSHNRTGLLAWLLGSVSSQLMHWDRHNLLIVR